MNPKPWARRYGPDYDHPYSVANACRIAVGLCGCVFLFAAVLLSLYILGAISAAVFGLFWH